MQSNVFFTPAIEAPVELRTAFLRRVAGWTTAGLGLTAVVSVLSALLLVPAVASFGRWAILLVVYGTFILSQTVARKMVYGESKVAGFLLGNAAQGTALGFILAFVAFGTGVGADGLLLIGQCVLLTMCSSIAMFLYVSMARREFSLLRSGLSMLFLPMLVLMGIQLIFPIGGTMGLIISSVFVLVSAGSLLYKLNWVTHELDTDSAMEGGYELSLAIVVLLWNLLSLFSRLRRN